MKALFGTLIIAALLSANTATATPNTPKSRSFETNTFITNQNKIWVAVEKSSSMPVTVFLRNSDNEVVFKRFIGKSESKFAAKLDVSELPEGQYELEFTSSEGSVKKTVSIGKPVVVEPTRMISMK
ncbi:hypothetical protein [Larkinella rosea]|uniref:T9SS C-terminal target domain-containing protein n=1 Tax=Larkinella rosea TaxID=2025312 RepID=A0A3P1BSP9_9BACT|nr:hypothetical protein [Larkinella rosea]RRB04042.1 hypothetical protein EHT25_10975 [Larkinella rosea]